MSRLTRASMLALLVRGYHPLRLCFPDRFQLSRIDDWPGPRSLATTSGVSVDVLSSRYLDVSVPWVRLKPPILFGGSYLLLILEIRNLKTSLKRFQDLGVPVSKVGFPIRKSADQSFFAAPHGLSQRSTSFIASQRQGIHRTPLRHLIALITNVHGHCVRRTRRARGVPAGTRGSLVRKTSLLHKIDPTARRSGFAEKRPATDASGDAIVVDPWR